MINTQTILTKKRLVVLSILVSLLIGLVYCYNHTILRLNPGDTGVEKVYIFDKSGQSKEVVMSGKNKTLMLKKGDYNIEASDKDRLSIFHKSLKAFSFSSVDIEFRDLKSGEHIGASKKECSYLNKENGTTYFYSCGLAYFSGIDATNDGQNFQSLVAPTEEAGDIVIKNSGNKLIMLTSRSGSLIVSDIIDNNKQIFKIDNFSGPLYEESVSYLVQNNKATVYILDEAAKKVFSSEEPFSNIKTTDVSKYISEDEATENIILHNEANFYVISKAYLGVGLGDDDVHGDNLQNPDHNSEKSQTTKQTIYSFSSIDRSFVGEERIGDEIKINKINLSNNGTILYNNIQSVLNPFYLVDNNATKTRQVGGPQNIANRLCWTDNNNFIYSDASNGSLFLYDTSKLVSFLIYRRTGVSISEVRCDNDIVYFSNVDQKDPDKSIQHFILVDKKPPLNLIENVVPLYFEVPSGLASLNVYRNFINIKLLYIDEGQNFDQEDTIEAINVAKKELASKQIDVSEYTFRFIE